MSAPLTDFEKTQALFFLGYSVFEDDGPAIRAFNSLPSQPLAGDFIRPMLSQIETLRCEIFSIRPLTKAIQDGAIQLRAHYTFKVLCAMGRQLVGQLSSITKVSIFSDIFGRGRGVDAASFYSGDPSEHRIDPQLGMPTRLSGT
jgi:hypothetical protein